MDDLVVMAMSLTLKTVAFLVAGVSLYQLGKYYDRKNSIAWKRVYDQMESQPVAMALYFGLRLLAFGVVAGFIYG